MSAHFAAPSGLAATGATIAGVKYMFVRGEENAEIYVKKVRLLLFVLAVCTAIHRSPYEAIDAALFTTPS